MTADPAPEEPHVIPSRLDPELADVAPPPPIAEPAEVGTLPIPLGRCPVDNGPRDPGRELCDECWRRLPEHLAGEVAAAWRNLHENTEDPARHAAWVSAVEAAVDHLRQ